MQVLSPTQTTSENPKVTLVTERRKDPTFSPTQTQQNRSTARDSPRQRPTRAKPRRGPTRIEPHWGRRRASRARPGRKLLPAKAATFFFCLPHPNEHLVRTGAPRRRIRARARRGGRHVRVLLGEAGGRRRRRMTRGWDGRWPRLRNPLMPLLREVGWGGVGREDEKGEAGGPSSLSRTHSLPPRLPATCVCVTVWWCCS
jgi:hypothetical protein